MRLSWSHKLFFFINKHIGKYPILDTVMVFCSTWLIFVLGTLVVYVALPLILFHSGAQLFFSFLSLLLTCLFGALLFNWTIAVVFPRRRPAVEFPSITELVHPMSHWKSFPSDHTTIAFIFFFFSFYYFVHLATWLVYFTAAMAIGVAVGRIYTGVHYPRDILGGIGVAFIFFFLGVFVLHSHILSFFLFLNSVLGLV